MQSDLFRSVPYRFFETQGSCLWVFIRGSYFQRVMPPSRQRSVHHPDHLNGPAVSV